jgi:hypothetical protein
MPRDGYPEDSVVVLRLLQAALVRVVSGIPRRKENECHNADAVFE